VVESAVVGSPHALKGFAVKAFVVLKTDHAPVHKNADEIHAFAKKNLAAYKTPRIIEFVKELPKTISGKIRRVEPVRMKRKRKHSRRRGNLNIIINSVLHSLLNPLLYANDCYAKITLIGQIFFPLPLQK